MLVSYLSVLSLCKRSAVVRFSYMKNQDDLMHKVSGIHQAHNEVRIEQVGSNLPIINLGWKLLHGLGWLQHNFWYLLQVVGAA